MTPQELYLDLLKQCLTRYRFGERFAPIKPKRGWKLTLATPFLRMIARRGLVLGRTIQFNQKARFEGRDWPPDAETMIGLQRLDNLQFCITDVLEKGVPGDLIETGVWRGGAVIFMRAVLEAYGDRSRRVWAADSFQGIPPPDPGTYPEDEGADWWKYSALAVSMDDVKKNIASYGLLDERVRFLPGWFRDTLLDAPIERLAVLRLDGDLYESTIVALRALYPKLSPGGYVIIDDHAIPNCAKAVADFRREQGIQTPMQEVDWSGVFWRRE